MTRVKRFLTGFGFVRKGFSFFTHNRSLWLYAIIPTLINLTVMVFMIWGLIHYFGDLTTWIFGDGGADLSNVGLLGKIWHWVTGAIIYAAKFLIFIILLLLIIIGMFVFSMILAEPFNDMLSEKVEQILTGNDYPFSLGYLIKSIKRSLIVALQKAGFFLTIPLLLLILNLVPVVGSAVYVILASIFTAFDIGFNFSDYPMSRKLWTFGERLKFARARKYELIGFGIVALIPLFPYIFGAPMVAGGTLLFQTLNDEY